VPASFVVSGEASVEVPASRCVSGQKPAAGHVVTHASSPAPSMNDWMKRRYGAMRVA